MKVLVAFYSRTGTTRKVGETKIEIKKNPEKLILVDCRINFFAKII